MESFGWADFGGLVLFLAIVYYGFYKRIYLPAVRRKSAERAVNKQVPGSKEQK